MEGSATINYDHSKCISVLEYFGTEGNQMQTITTKIVQNWCKLYKWDMLWFIFIGHGFGKGPGYLYGKDEQV
jgi:hypothetical protein